MARSKNDRSLSINLLFIIILVLIIIYYVATSNYLNMIILGIILFSILLIILSAINYTEKMQKKLLKDMASILYDKAVALENAQSDMNGHAGNSNPLLPIEKPDIDFSDVGGMDSVKEEIKKVIVYPFEHPRLYSLYGKRIGDGIMLYGPPGCGKTYIARAAAGECGSSFINLKISDILSKWVGESEKNIRSAFDAASKHAPAILFFDEIDALGGKRGEVVEGPTRRLVNELLIQLDGFEGPKERVLTLAATNEPWSVDPAMRRPGRFSKMIFVPPPDLKARKEIFRLLLKGRPVSEDIDFKMLAELTEGYSSADIKQICEESADIPLKEAIQGNKPRAITMKDFRNVIKHRRSSLDTWVKLARRQLQKGMEQEVFDELSKVLDEYRTGPEKKLNQIK